MTATASAPRRTSGRAPRLLALLVLLLLHLPACATTVGTLAGPVTGPITFWRHTHGVPPWAKPILLPLTVPVGPFLGLVEGARADWGFLVHGEYGTYPSPPFEIVFDPTNTELDRPPMRPWPDH